MKQKKELTFRDVYKFPLRQEEFCDIKVYTDDFHMAFDWCVRFNLTAQNILDSLNNGKPYGRPEWTYQNVHVCYGETPIMLIRGWGYLTGCGGLNLPSEEAERIQDEFGQWIADTLNGKGGEL